MEIKYAPHMILGSLQEEMDITIVSAIVKCGEMNEIFLI